MQVIFSGETNQDSGVAVNDISGGYDNIIVNGLIMLSTALTIGIGYTDSPGLCVIVLDGKVYARIAMHKSDFSIDNCFALPLPLFAYVEGESIEPISIDGEEKAGWGLFNNLSRVRIAGYNLPTNLKYRAGSESVLQDLTADGGDYGIEFTQPDLTTLIVVIEGIYWLFLDRR